MNSLRQRIEELDNEIQQKMNQRDALYETIYRSEELPRLQKYIGKCYKFPLEAVPEDATNFRHYRYSRILRIDPERRKFIVEHFTNEVPDEFDLMDISFSVTSEHCATYEDGYEECVISVQEFEEARKQLIMDLAKQSCWPK